VFLWTGDLRAAEQYLGRLISCAESHSLAPYLLVGRGFEGDLAIRRGRVSKGVASLRSSLEELHVAPYELLTTAFNIALVQGLSASGRLAEAADVIDGTIRQVEANGDCCYMPELLRLKGGLLLAKSQTSDGEAERCFLRSLEASRRQGARAWELRTAIDLAALLARQGRGDRARVLLQPIFEGFAEGLETADLKAAERLAATLGPSDLRGSGERAAPDHAPRSRRPERAGAAATGPPRGSAARPR
jgi:predicted ATPase